jgi:hypothetical protein
VVVRRSLNQFAAVNISIKLGEISKLAGIIVAALGGLGIGYHFGAQHEEPSSLFAAAAPLNYYFSELSFSEVENTKASLDGLCQRFRTEIWVKRLADQKSCATVTGREPRSEPHIKETIANLERGINEFAGTSQQVEVAQDLLLTLRRAKEFDRWVQVYLTALYEQPTHRVVARFAREALEVAKLCGREQEVLIGLGHVEEIPVDFEGKLQIQAALQDRKGSLAVNDRRASGL